MRSKFKWIFTLLVAFTMQFSFAQQKTVTGTVISDGVALPGASIKIKGTNQGTTSNDAGKYSIKAKEGDVLVVTFLNKKDQSATVGASNVINFTLAGADKEIVEVVVTSLNQKKRSSEITSSKQVVKADELNRASATNAVQALVGKVSGLQINTTSNGVNPDNRVVLRGPRSITGNNQALVVIDGAISSLAVLQQIAPESIASTTVLKGPQGSAIYGSDGVNGVIIVTTVKGSTDDKVRVNYKSSVDISTIAYLPTRQLRYGQGWDGLHASQENGSWGPEFDGTMQPVGMMQADGTFITAPYSPIKDGYKKFFKNGVIYQNALTISGGNLDKGYVSLTLNRLVNDFVVKGDQLKRNSFLFKAGKKIGKLTVEGNFSYINDATTEAASSLYGNLLQSSSNIPVELFENSGNDGHWTTYYNNPYWLRDNQRRDSGVNNLTSIVNLSYELNKNISISYLANLRMIEQEGTSYNNAYVDNAAPLYGGRSRAIVGSYSTFTSMLRNYYGDLIVNFNYDLSDSFKLKALVGQNIQDKYNKINQVGGTNFAVPGVYSYSNMQSPSLASSLSNNWQRQRKVGVFAEATLGFKDYLFLNVTARNDWTSTLSVENNSFFYPSAGLSVLPLKALNIESSTFNYLKLFGNVTRVGNDSNVGVYSINQLATLGIGYPFSGLNSYVQPISQTFAGIKPEMVTTKEIGLEAGFLRDRITLGFNYYVADTKDLVSSQTTSAASGLFSLTSNVSLMQTKGYEIDLGFTPIKSKKEDGFRWDNKISLTHFTPTVKKVSSQANQIALRTPYDFVGIYAQEGETFPTIKGTTYERDSFGRIIVDANGNPSVNPTLQVLGTATPDYIIAFSPSLSYKGVRLTATMDYRGGKNYKFYSDVKRNMSWTGQLVESAENRGGFVMPNSSYDYNGDGVYSSNESNSNVLTGGGSMANFINYYNSYYSTTGENLVIDASAFKVREIALSYTMPKRYIQKVGLNSLVFSVNARNPISIFAKQNRNYNDPETSETTGNASGLAFTDRYPAQSTYGFSINVGF